MQSWQLLKVGRHTVEPRLGEIQTATETSSGKGNPSIFLIKSVLSVFAWECPLTLYFRLMDEQRTEESAGYNGTAVPTLPTWRTSQYFLEVLGQFKHSFWAAQASNILAIGKTGAQIPCAVSFFHYAPCTTWQWDILNLVQDSRQIQPAKSQISETNIQL